MSTQNETPVSFAIGDTVTFSHAYLRQDVNRSNEQMLITGTDVSYGNNTVMYAVDGNAWFSKDDLEFVSSATPESLARAVDLELEAADENSEVIGEEDPDNFQ